LKSEARNQENYYESTEAGWKNSTVLIEYPEEIKKLEINKITPIDNSLAVVGYDKFEKDGKQYLKVYLQSEKPVNQPSFNIDSNITVDPLAKSKNTTAKIYYYNSYPSSYLQFYKSWRKDCINDFYAPTWNWAFYISLWQFYFL